MSAITPPICARCDSTEVKLRKQITASGGIQIAWRCMDCNRWAEKPIRWLPHYPLQQAFARNNWSIADIPVIEDYSDAQPCIICGAPGEIHHWAPQAYQDVFGDEWISYPTASLCLEHHQQWHKIVTPSLVYHIPLEKF